MPALAGDDSAAQPPDMDRPFGVTVIAVALVANALVSLIRLTTSGSDVHRVLGQLDYFRVANPAFGLIALALAVGLWRLERWAWVLTMLWVGANMVLALLAFLNEREHFLSMALSVVTVFYLNQREVQIAFLGKDLHQDPDDV
jgi:hypothetical protein